MSRLRQLGFAFGIACVLAGTAGPAAAGGRHPLFDDRGTLTWYTSLDEAQAVARATGKMIFIEQGRLHCPNCQSFVERVLPAPSVRARVCDIAIGLADDADESDPRVDRLLSSGIANPTVLPLCGFVTPELKWSSGWAGYMDAGTFGGHLSLAEDRYRQVQSYRKRISSTPPAPACPPSIGGGECEGGSCRLPSKKVPPVAPTSPSGKSTAPVTPPAIAKVPPVATPAPTPRPAAPPVAKLPLPTAPAVPATPPAILPATPPVAKLPPRRRRRHLPRRSSRLGRPCRPPSCRRRRPSRSCPRRHPSRFLPRARRRRPARSRAPARPPRPPRRRSPRRRRPVRFRWIAPVARPPTAAGARS